MGWHDSRDAFVRHRGYLDRMLKGETQFETHNSQSLARTLRGLIKGIREREEPGYEDLYNARINVITKFLVGVELDVGDTLSYRTFKASTFYQIVSELSTLVPNSIYYFTHTLLDDEEKEMLKAYCDNKSLSLEIHKDEIKVTA